MSFSLCSVYGTISSMLLVHLFYLLDVDGITFIVEKVYFQSAEAALLVASVW